MAIRLKVMVEGAGLKSEHWQGRYERTQEVLRLIDELKGEIDGAKLTDIQVETLLSNLSSIFFRTCDEQEVAGYA